MGPAKRMPTEPRRAKLYTISSLTAVVTAEAAVCGAAVEARIPLGQEASRMENLQGVPSCILTFLRVVVERAEAAEGCGAGEDCGAEAAVDSHLW